MDKPKLPISSHFRSWRTDADDAPVTVGNPRPANDSIVVSSNDKVGSPANPHQENTHIVFCDDEQEIREGFAIALRVMGLEQSQ